MHKLLALVLVLGVTALPLTACGDEPDQTAAEFCADHGGIDEETREPDGDVTCTDGTQYEADGDEGSSGSKKKGSKSSRPGRRR